MNAGIKPNSPFTTMAQEFSHSRANIENHQMNFDPCQVRFDLKIEMCEEIKVLSKNGTSSHPPCHRRNTEWCLVNYVLLNLGSSMARRLFWPSKAFLYLMAPSLTSGAVSSLMWTSLNWECSGMEAHLWMLNHTWNCANYIYSLHRLAYLSSSMVIFFWTEMKWIMFLAGSLICISLILQ